MRPFTNGNGLGRLLPADSTMRGRPLTGVSASELVRSPPPHSGNLPAELSSFVGRERELAELRDALASSRLLTLTGAGGCGKTRLALQLAGDVLDRYPGGAWWVELAPLAEPELLADALTTAIGVRPLPGMTAAEAAIAQLAPKRCLLVLDNCEHLLEPCSQLAEQLLANCPGLSVIATSREPLGLAGETSWRVPSLSLPPEASADPVASLRVSDGGRLFLERAAQVRPGFALTPQAAPVVARICRDLDGIPLAIELAAARVRMLSPEQIASGLADRFRLLTGGARTALPRQRTLRASVEWSHDLLGEDGRVLLRRLGVFAGGFTLELAEQVCAGEELGRDSILDLLTSLVDRSLVIAEQHGSLSRFRLLETVRHFALDRLTAAGEAARLRERHRDAFLALAERLEAELLSERQPQALEVLDAERANLQAAIELAAETQPEIALRLAAALTFWWRLRGLLADGDAAFRRALGASTEDQPALRGRALWGRAYLATASGDTELGERTATEALEIAEDLGDQWLQGRALQALAILRMFPDPAGAVQVAGRSRDLARSAGDDFALADATQVLGGAYWCQDAYESARRELDRSLEVAERIGNRETMAWYWLLRAMMPFGGADLVRRRALLERGLARSAEIGEPASEGFGTAWVAQLEVWSGDPVAALERLVACLERLVAAGAGPPIASVQERIGLAEAALGRGEEARATLTDVVARDADSSSWTLSTSLAALAALERLAGDGDGARSHAGRALEVAEHVGSPLLHALARHELGRQAGGRGEWREAERSLHDSLADLIDGGHRVLVPDSLEGLAEVAAGLESRVEAALLLAAAAAARARIGIVRWTGEDGRWEALERDLRRTLGEEAYATAAAEGGELTIDEAVAYVRRSRGRRKRPAGGWDSLTPTEAEVVRHAAAGLTNPEIGERMFIARNTVKTHLLHIYAKLGLRNRAELAAAEAARRARDEGDRGGREPAAGTQPGPGT